MPLPPPPPPPPPEALSSATSTRYPPPAALQRLRERFDDEARREPAAAAATEQRRVTRWLYRVRLLRSYMDVLFLQAVVRDDPANATPPPWNQFVRDLSELWYN